jgi:hypothetical protein
MVAHSSLSRLEAFAEHLLGMKGLVAGLTTEFKKHMYLLKLTLSEKYEEKKVELVFKTNLFEGMVRNEDYVLAYMRVYKHLRPLYLSFRRLLHRLGLDDPFTGGINTFSIFLMIVAFLQKMDNPSPHRVAESTPNLDVTNTSFKSTISGSTRAKEKFEHSVNLSVQNAANRVSLGELFLNLIYYYGFTFDYKEWFIRPFVNDLPPNESVFKVS